jgi:hypothetical protein
LHGTHGQIAATPDEDCKMTAGSGDRNIRSKAEHSTVNEIKSEGPVVFTPEDICPGKFKPNELADKSTIDKYGLATAADLLGRVVKEGPENPHPSSWKYDEKGHLVQAGNVFSASYDAKGDLSKVTMKDQTWERTGPSQVTETFMGNDHQLHKHVTDNVTNFSATPNKGNFQGAYSGAEVKVNFGTSGSGSSTSSKLYESAAHQTAVNSFWASERACEQRAREKGSEK